MNQQLSNLIVMVLSACWRRRRLLIVPFALVLTAGLIYAKIAPKPYAARALLLLQEVSRDLPISRELPSSGRTQDRAIALQALLKSNRVLHSVMMELAEPEIINDPKLASGWINGFSKSLSLEAVGNDFIELRLAGESPIGLGERLNVVTVKFFEALLSSNDVLSATQVLLDGMKQRAADAEVAVNLFLKGTTNPNSRDASKLTDQVTTLRARLASRTSDIEAQYTALEALRRQMKLTQTTKRPVNPQTQTENVPPGPDGPRAASTSEANLTSALQTAEQNYEAIVTEVAGLKRNLSEAEARLAQFTQSNQTLTALQQRLAETRRVYQDYARKFTVPTNTRTIGLLSAPERIKLIDPPRDPESPERSALKIVLLSILASLAAAIGAVLLAELLDNTVRSRKEIEDLTGAPVLARLPAA